MFKFRSARRIALFTTLTYFTALVYWLFYRSRMLPLYANFGGHTNPLLSNSVTVIFIIFIVINSLYWFYLKNNVEANQEKFVHRAVSVALIFLPLAFLCFRGIFPSKQAGVNKTKMITPTSVPLSDATYTNRVYGFTIRYPMKYVLIEDKNTEKYYDKVAELALQNNLLRIRAISGIDIYETGSAKMVAEREILDSGLRYTVSEVSVYSYKSALTVVENEVSRKTTKVYTIAHPGKNLYIEISSSIDPQDLEDIVSSFRFTDL